MKDRLFGERFISDKKIPYLAESPLVYWLNCLFYRSMLNLVFKPRIANTILKVINYNSCNC